MAVCAMSTTISKLPSAVRAVASSSKLLTSNASLGFPSMQMCAENKLFQPQRLTGTCVRPMATSAARESPSEDSESKLQRREDGVPVGRGRTRRSLGITPSVADFFDLWDPFFPDRNLREMMNTMKRVFRDPVEYSAPVDQQRTPWDVIEDEEGFKLRVDMPGLSKEEVAVTVEEGTLVIKGEHKADENKEDNNFKWSKRSYGTYNTRLTLPKNVSVDQIKAELKNGVLYVSVPKAEAKKDVINVDVA